MRSPMSLSKCVLITLAAAGVSGALVWAKDARAYSGVWYPASLCQPECLDFSAGCAPGSLGMSGQGQYANLSADSQFLYCPVPSGTGVGVANTAYDANVNGWANAAYPASGSVPAAGTYVIACRTFGTGGGGSCGRYYATAVNAVYQAQILDFSVWTAGTTWDSYYIGVNMGPTTNGSNNTLFGYFVATND
jgi:hypothetical protein